MDIKHAFLTFNHRKLLIRPNDTLSFLNPPYADSWLMGYLHIGDSSFPLG